MWNQELASKNLGEELQHLALDKSKLQVWDILLDTYVITVLAFPVNT